MYQSWNYKELIIIFVNLTLWVICWRLHIDKIHKNKINSNNIQLFVFEEPNIEIYRCVKGDIGPREAEVNITYHTLINLDIRLLKHQLLFYYSFGWYYQNAVSLRNIANQFIYLLIYLFILFI